MSLFEGGRVGSSNDKRQIGKRSVYGRVEVVWVGCSKEKCVGGSVVDWVSVCVCV